jgi:hypothetical protein
MTPDEAVSRLEDLRSALRTGDLTCLEATGETLRRIEAAAGSWAASDLARVRDSAARSGGLLQASASGLRSVRRRLTEIATVQETGGTYGADGRKSAARPTPTRDAGA